jgi:hypothetical protein
MATPKVPRRSSTSSHASKVKAKTVHRRSGATKKLSKRVISKLFRGRTVNAPKGRW